MWPRWPNRHSVVELTESISPNGPEWGCSGQFCESLWVSVSLCLWASVASVGLCGPGWVSVCVGFVVAGWGWGCAWSSGWLAGWLVGCLVGGWFVGRLPPVHSHVCCQLGAEGAASRFDRRNESWKRFSSKQAAECSPRMAAHRVNHFTSFWLKVESGTTCNWVIVPLRLDSSCCLPRCGGQGSGGGSGSRGCALQPRGPSCLSTNASRFFK